MLLAANYALSLLGCWAVGLLGTPLDFGVQIGFRGTAGWARTRFLWRGEFERNSGRLMVVDRSSVPLVEQ